jgi:hypothetical protein
MLHRSLAGSLGSRSASRSQTNIVGDVEPI